MIPQDVFDVVPEVLRHRLILTYDALAQNITPDDIVRHVISTVPAPHVTPRQDEPEATAGSPQMPWVVQPSA